MQNATFSERHGLLGSDAEPVPRNVVPPHVCQAIVQFASASFQARDLHKHLVRLFVPVPLKPPATLDDQIRSDIVAELLESRWYEVYEYLEELYRELRRKSYTADADELQRRINRYFEKYGIAWRLTRDALEPRGSAALEAISDSVVRALDKKGMAVAAVEIRAAIADLSLRPDPDITGAIQHSIAALECVARTVTNLPKLRLGQIVARRRSDLLPAPISEAVEKLWGYASETVRHVREGQSPTFEQAEFIVSVASSVITFLLSANVVTEQDAG